MIIRRAKPEDNITMADIYVDSYGDAFAAVAEEFNTDSFRQALLETLAQPSQTILLEDEGKVLGFLRASSDGHLIDKLYVLPSAQGQGVGRALMETHMASMQATHPGDKLWLMADSFNETALCLYRSLGFVHRGLRFHGVIPGEDVLVFEKKLPWGQPQ